MNDLIIVFFWWLVIFVFGISVFPFTSFIFSGFKDNGWIFSKILGVGLISYLVFILGSLKLFPFTQTLTVALLILIALANIVFLPKLGNIRKKWKLILAEEILFFTALFAWAFVRGNAPEIRGLEKFMDFGFLNSILRSASFPPSDIWMAGETINYYYFGHLTVSVLTKFSNIPSSVAYNLMIATIFALSFVAAFSLISTIIHSLAKYRPSASKFLSNKLDVIGGLISALLLTLGGNLHTLWWHATTSKPYWYPDATRFIGYNPPTADKTIHEFPIYSFVVSDLHAHLLNLPFALLYIALLYKLIKDKSRRGFPTLFLLGFVLAIGIMTNTWDFPIYLTLTGISLFVSNINFKNFFGSIFKIVIPFLAVVFLSLVLASPFLVNFKSISEGIGIVETRTPLWQLLVLWGSPAVLTTIYILTLTINKKSVNLSGLFVISLIVTGWLLVAIPEIVYVKDIYIGEYKRANTMFKLTYQAFVLFSLSSGFVIVRTFELAHKFAKPVLLIAYCLLLIALLSYPYFAIPSYYNSLKVYKGLDGSSWLDREYPENKRVIEWFENIPGQPIILEAAGDSYTDFNQISSYSGLPTVEGWLVHEWLWRGGFEEPGKRADGVAKIYTSADLVETKDLLKKYNVSYIIIGQLEREKYQSLEEDKFSQIAELVFRSGETKVYLVNKSIL